MAGFLLFQGVLTVPVSAAETVSRVASPVDALATRAAALRLIASTGPRKIVPVLSAKERNAAKPLTLLSPAPRARFVGTALGQSTAFVNANGSDGLVAWWNPFDDAFVVSRWILRDGSWTLGSIGALLGSDLGGGSASGPAEPLDWPRHGTDLDSALAAQNASGFGKLRAAIAAGTLPAMLDDPARQARAWNELVRRQAFNEAVVVTAGRSIGSDYRAQLSTALAKPAAAGIDPTTSKLLSRLSPAALITLRPVMVVKTKVLHAVALQSPIKPAFVVLADFDKSLPSRKPARFRVISLFVGQS